MKIICLIDNVTYGKGLMAEHGLSFYLEEGDLKLLFDTGQTGNIVRNAELLGVDLSRIDYLVLSHGHYDHTGGVGAFLKVNSKAKIIVKREIFRRKFSGEREIGFPKTIIIPEKRLIYVDQPFQLPEGVMVMPRIETYEIDGQHIAGFGIEEDGKQCPDPFDDELFLTIRKVDQIHLISSCSHRGIRNIIATAEAYFGCPVVSVFGGFHLKDDADAKVIDLIEYFNKNNIKRIGINHCTGVEKYALFKQYAHGEVFYFHTGREINV